MSKLTWDDTGKRQYETGTDRGVLYPFNSETSAYDKGVAWNGLSGVTESPGGAELTDIWADNIKYASLRSAETFGGTIEAYTYPDEFETCDGSEKLAEGVVIGQQTRKTFGFSYRTKIGNDVTEEAGYKIHLVYGATVNPSEKAYQSINDSPEAITMSWEFSTVPVPVSTLIDGKALKPTATIVIDTTKLAAEKVAKVEKALYGDEMGEAKLPLPDEIYALITEE